MPTCMLIIFEYNNTNNYLPGAIIDLYHSYNYFKNYDINIITDITNIDNELLEEAIDAKIVKDDILKFYNSINPYIYTNYNNLLSKIKDTLITIKDEKLIIYYSGHGLNDCLVLPSTYEIGLPILSDKKLFPMIEFRNLILSSISPYVEIFWILDCCNPNGLHLPFKLNGNMFSLATINIDKIDCIPNQVLLITSAENHQKSTATNYGSLFTRYLFQALTTMNVKSNKITLSLNRNLRRLMGNLSSSIRKMYTGHIQNISIYSSYMIDPVLPLWIGKNLDYDIVTDYTLNKLIIKNII